MEGNFDSNQNTESTVSYRTVNTFKEKKSGFGKTIFVPFISGVVGASLVVGVCFGIPSVNEKILGLNKNDSSNSTISASSNIGNSDLVSLSNFSDTGSSVAKKVLPSIVGITVEYNVNSVFGGQSKSTATGSGIIISEDGYIITNNHVISNTSNKNSFYQVSEANNISVHLYNDSNNYTGTIVGTDEKTDLAVIKIDKTGLTPAELGNSDELQIGEFAMALGNPLGLDYSVTTGSISATNRTVKDSDGKEYTLIQTDAAINSGNSGGALVNSKGQVIGINFMKISQVGVEGICFAIPITPSIDICNQLIQYSKVKRPYIGIVGQSVTESISKMYNLPIGIYVQEVDAFSNAQKAGIKVGDVITKIDGNAVTTMTELENYKYTKQIGDEIKINITRDGSEFEIKLVLTEEP